MRIVKLFTIFAVIASLGASCSPHKVSPPAETPPPHSWYWVDLRPGWRVRVVTPVTRSGSFVVNPEPVPAANQSSGSAQTSHHSGGKAVINLKAGKDLIGFEVSLYSGKPRRGGGVRLAFRSAVLNKSGKKAYRRHPLLSLFLLPRNDRYVRILHLARGSHGDHDAAILAASSREYLQVLTKNVEFHAAACAESAKSFCSWVPAGVAAVPERKKKNGEGSQWTPVY